MGALTSVLSEMKRCTVVTAQWSFALGLPHAEEGLEGMEGTTLTTPTDTTEGLLTTPTPRETSMLESKRAPDNSFFARENPPINVYLLQKFPCEGSALKVESCFIA